MFILDHWLIWFDFPLFSAGGEKLDSVTKLQGQYTALLKQHIANRYPYNPNRYDDMLQWLPHVQTASALLIESKMIYIPFFLNCWRWRIALCPHSVLFSACSGRDDVKLCKTIEKALECIPTVTYNFDIVRANFVSILHFLLCFFTKALRPPDQSFVRYSIVCLVNYRAVRKCFKSAI